VTRRVSFRLVLALVALVAIGFGGALNVAAQTEISKVAFITPASITNLGWDQQGADGLTAAAEELGFEAIIQENGGYEDITPALKDLADQGAQLIICHASGYPTTCADFSATENIPVAVVENESVIKPGMVSSYVTEAQEAAYVAGVAAAKSSKTGHVAIIVSGEPPTWNFMTVGFAEGVKAADGSTKVTYLVIGDAAYDDSAGAKRVTEQALAAGADVIFGMGDGATFGMIEAIRDFNEANADAPAKFIDVIGDKTEEYSDVLLTSIVFDYSGIYKQMVEDLEAGTFGKNYIMDLENEGVFLLDLPEGTDAAVTDAVKAAQEGIIGGTITVSSIGDPEGMKAKLQELGYT
jgi:simple sugar transport system substrate-binding protein